MRCKPFTVPADENGVCVCGRESITWLCDFAVTNTYISDCSVNLGWLSQIIKIPLSKSQELLHQLPFSSVVFSFIYQQGEGATEEHI